MFRPTVLAIFFCLAACGAPSDDAASGDAAPAQPQAATDAAESAAPAGGSRLAEVLAAQPEEVRARYQYRHPQETLEFFGIEPGMTVVEGLPGRGWYTKILVDYLGKDGRLIGANYSLEMYPLFSWMTDELLAEQQGFVRNFPVEAAGWGGEDGAAADAFHFGAIPDEFRDTADAVLLVRALHNTSRFQNEGKGEFLDAALADAYAALKPGGVLGVVQHHARDDMSDEFANGSHGYLKKDWLIGQIEDAGFEFVASSDINANPKDHPTEDDVVWRLPPGYSGTRDDPALKAAVDAVGESNRMTLRFVKPE